MPHASDVQPTSHADHDALLVAALAADDLAGTDRDHATLLVETCTECRTLHDDLVAIARATSVVPPPVLTRPRDFRLTSEQAAHLRPRGWRRMLGAFGGPRLAFAKPLGIALTTIGLAGLLVTNIPLGLGGASSAAAPAAARVDMSAASSDVTGESSTGNTGSYGGVLAPAGSGVPAASPDVAAPAPAASAASVASAGAAASVPAAVGSQAPPDRNLSAAPQAAASGRLEAGGPKTQSSAQPNTAGGAPTDQSLEPARPMDLRILFGAAVVVGLALLVLRRVGRRVPSA